jgi:hypothetical protein
VPVDATDIDVLDPIQVEVVAAGCVVIGLVVAGVVDNVAAKPELTILTSE